MTLLRPINATTPAQSAAIRAIAPSEDRRHGSERILVYPCAVTLIDGTVYERAYCNYHARYSDAGDWINPENVAEIRESPYRLPVHLARKLYAAGESGMGYLFYRLQFRSQPDVVFLGGNYRFDFPDLPEEYDMRDVVDLKPHDGRDAKQAPRSHRCDGIIEFIFHDDPRMTNAG